LQGIDITLGNTTKQVRPNILYIFCFLRINIAWEVQIVVIFMLDLIKRDHTTIALYLKTAIEDIYNFTNILCPESIFIAIFDKVLTGIYHKDTLATGGMLFVYDNDTRRNPCAVKEVGRQSDDPLDIAMLNEVTTDLSFCTTTEQDTMR
jgi:hypothetical protein